MKLKRKSAEENRSIRSRAFRRDPSLTKVFSKERADAAERPGNAIEAENHETMDVTVNDL